MIGEAVRRGLVQDGFAVDWVRDGHAAELALAEKVHELLLLDLGLPRKEGLDVLAAMRRGGDARPVLVLTARDAVADRVAGLDAGADDYLVKPFELDRARAPASGRSPAGRRPSRAPDRAGRRSTIDPATREVLRRRRAGRAVGARVRAARGAGGAAGGDPVARAARGAALRLEGRGRQQRRRSAPVDRCGASSRPGRSATCAAWAGCCRGLGTTA